MKLESHHYQAIFLLVAGKDNAHVARKLGVHKSQITRWRHDEGFNLALQRAYSQVYDDALNKLATVAIKAADYLEKVIDDPDAPTRVKLQAISLVLSHGQKIKDFQLAARLEKLEELAFEEVESATDIEI